MITLTKTNRPEKMPPRVYNNLIGRCFADTFDEEPNDDIQTTSRKMPSAVTPIPVRPWRQTAFSPNTRCAPCVLGVSLITVSVHAGFRARF